MDGTADRLDLADPFQRKWYIRQVIEHGKAEDVANGDTALAEFYLGLRLSFDLDFLYR